MKTALFPGSFDPVTLGHAEIIHRGLHLFDRVIVGIGKNSMKQSLFPLEKRLEMLHKVFAGEHRILIEPYDGLTVKYALERNAHFILRGIRNAADLEYERGIALMNQHMEPEVETVLLMSSTATAHISSTLVRELIRYKADVTGLVPDVLLTEIGK